MRMKALLCKNNTNLNKDMQRINTISMEKNSMYFTIVRSYKLVQPCKTEYHIQLFEENKTLNHS